MKFLIFTAICYLTTHLVIKKNVDNALSVREETLNMNKHFFFIFIFFLACSCSCSSQSQHATDLKLQSAEEMKTPLRFSKFAVPSKKDSYVGRSLRSVAVADKPHVTDVARTIFKQGGNAFDVAVAMSFAAAVTAPQSTGLGGGGFMLYKTAKEYQVIDFRERAPEKSHEKMFDSQLPIPFPELIKPPVDIPDVLGLKPSSVDGHLAVATPGLVAGLLEVHRRYGKLPRRAIIQPSIQLARKGFPVYGHLARALQNRRGILKKSEDAVKIFFRNDEPLKNGYILVQKDLANTLELIAAKGWSGFYRGQVASAIVNEMKKHDGLLTYNDLLSYRVKYHKPLRGNYRGHQIITMPPPSSGGTHIIQMLNMLEQYDLALLRPQTSQYSHLLAEVMRRAYYDRSKYLGDTAFVKVPLKGLLSKKYAEEQIQTIDDKKATASQTFNPPSPYRHESSGTSNICVVDRAGNVIVTTQSINYEFGSGVVVPGTGIVLNDSMDDFSQPSGENNVSDLITGQANRIAERKTPLNSMAPTIVLRDGKPWLVVGSPGGPQIITAILQVILHKIDFSLSLGESVSLKRIHHQFLPDRLHFDAGALGSSTQQRLKSRGHKLFESTMRAQVTAIEIHPNGLLEGAVDARSYGDALGDASGLED